jgi:hypothetical protein
LFQKEDVAVAVDVAAVVVVAVVLFVNIACFGEIAKDEDLGSIETMMRERLCSEFLVNDDRNDEAQRQTYEVLGSYLWWFVLSKGHEGSQYST